MRRAKAAYNTTAGAQRRPERIHDAADALDHYAPCTLPGDVLAPFRPYIDRTPIRVLELSGRLDAETIVAGTERFVARYGGAAGEGRE